MIVRDGGPSLDRCLASAAPLVDRIVMGDTGSTDVTASIARRYAAECLPVRWSEDFATARNEVLALARCDWVLVLDADEMLDLSQAKLILPQLLENTAIHAYALERWDYVSQMQGNLIPHNAQANPGYLPQAQDYPAYTRTYHTRLFRRHPKVYYRGCVHEQVTERIDLAGLPRGQAALLIHHFGEAESPLTEKVEKINFYHRLGLKKVAQEPRNSEAHLQLGIMELFQLGVPKNALPYLCKAVMLCPKDSRNWLYHGICLLRLGRSVEAQRSLLQALKLGETDPAIYDALGDTFMLKEQFGRAVDFYRKAYGVGSVSPITDAKMGAAEVYLGNAESGLERIRDALRWNPASPLLKGLLEVSEQRASVLSSPMP